MRNPVLGQEKLQETLFHEIMRGQLPHALLFCGQPGCGKLALALAYAGSLLCQHKQTPALPPAMSRVQNMRQSWWLLVDVCME